MVLADNTAELLIPIAQGDEQAFAQLFHRHKQMVYNVAWTYTEDVHAAEEILQDVFVIAWKKRQQLPTIQDLTAWLYVIARNRSLRVLKEMTGRELDTSKGFSYTSLIEQDHTRQVSESQLQELLGSALALLSPQQRKVFELSRMERLPREAVAEQLGISKSTVSVHLTIALKIVRAFLLSRLDLILVLALFPEFF